MTGRASETGMIASARRRDVGALRDLLKEVSWKLGRIQSGLTVDIGLTAPQATALDAIHHLGPDIDMVTLAASINLPPSSVTSIIDRLEELGYVVRGRREGDRRRVTASVTAEGERMSRQIEERGDRLIQWLFADVDLAQVEATTQLFQHFNRKIDRHGAAFAAGAEDVSTTPDS